MTDYLLCGWRTRSNIELPELPTWEGDDRALDVEIVCSAAPPAPSDENDDLDLVEPAVALVADGQDALVLSVSGVGQFRVEGGRRVTVDRWWPSDDADLRLFLLGTTLAALTYQRGLLPLHASCLAFPPDHRAVAIGGESGAGKSTLAAMLAVRGLPVLADDVCVIDPWAPGGPVVLPSVARLKLWRDALDRLDMPVDGMTRVRSGMEKFSLRDIPVFRTAHTRLARIYQLTRDPASCGAPTPLSGLPAVRQLLGMLYRPTLANAMGRDAQMRTGVMQVLQHAPLFSVARTAADDPNGPAVWDRVVMHHATVRP